MFSIFTLAIKFDCFFLCIFQSFYWFVTFIFDKVAPPWIHVSKDAINHFLVHSSTKNSLRKTKNEVFFLFCILVDRLMRYWLVSIIVALTNSIKLSIANSKFLPKVGTTKWLTLSSFSFLLSSFKIGKKWHNKFAENFFFLLWCSPKFSRKNTPTKRRKTFFRFGFYLKIGLLTYLHAAPSKLKVENSTLLQTRRHGGAYRSRAPQLTACASPNENCAPQTRTVPRRN